MATIVIRDLQESIELDRQAMLAIAGGARFRAARAGVQRPAPSRTRLFALASAAAQAATRPPPR